MNIAVIGFLLELFKHIVAHLDIVGHLVLVIMVSIVLGVLGIMVSIVPGELETMALIAPGVPEIMASILHGLRVIMDLTALGVLETMALIVPGEQAITDSIALGALAITDLTVHGVQDVLETSVIRIFIVLLDLIVASVQRNSVPHLTLLHSLIDYKKLTHGDKGEYLF